MCGYRNDHSGKYITIITAYNCEWVNGSAICSVAHEGLIANKTLAPGFTPTGYDLSPLCGFAMEYEKYT